MEKKQNYRRLQLGVGNDLETGFQTLLFLMKNPEIAGYLRHLEVHGSRRMSDGLDVDFNTPPDEPRELELDDLERLKAAIERAGFTEGNEPQMVLHMLLQRHAGNLRALAALLIAISPQLESLAVFHVGEPSCKAEDLALLTMLRRANKNPDSIPYLQHLRRIIFLPDVCSVGNDGFYYNIAEDYHHRLNLVRRLPALKSVSFSLASWNNEAGLPPPPKSANYSEISFTHSNLAGNESEMCYIIDSSKALRKFTYTIGGRAQPEGGKVSVSFTSIIRCLWRHRHHLEELDLDVEDNVSWAEIYGNEGLESTEGIEMDEDTEYEELWEGEMEELDMNLETPPANISLADFPNLKGLGLGVHTLCFLARGIGPGRLDAKSFSLVHTLPASLQSIRLYGKGDGDSALDLRNHHPDLDVDTLLEKLVAEKDARLPTLKTIEGFDPVIPRGKEFPECADEDHPLLWEQPKGCIKDIVL
ncbi:hypothetical protein N7454_007042 [Penicillium verhagenii]|nr:hypothetical protein N7454_007042 [Penicillium verhagenii]